MLVGDVWVGVWIAHWCCWAICWVGIGVRSGAGVGIRLAGKRSGCRVRVWIGGGGLAGGTGGLWGMFAAIAIGVGVGQGICAGLGLCAAIAIGVGVGLGVAIYWAVGMWVGDCGAIWGLWPDGEWSWSGGHQSPDVIFG